MSKGKWPPLWIALLPLVLILTWADGVCGEDEVCPCTPKICCPVEGVQKVNKVIYSVKVAEVCFPPSPFDLLKRCLGFGAHGVCGPCCGKPRAIHKLYKKIETEEHPQVRYEAVECGLHHPTPAK